MEKIVLISLLSLVCVCHGQTSNSTEPLISLRFYKTSGLYQSMTNSTTFVDHFLKMYGINGRDTSIPINLGPNSKLRQLGTTPIEQVERSELAVTLNHAGCDIYDQVVSIPNDRPNVVMYPSCVLLKQCGGCCMHPSLSCKAIETVPKTVQVLKYVYDGRSLFPVQEVNYLQMEEHTKCQCQCKTTEEDCTPELHKFDSYDCKCVCKREREECPSNKRWNENLCACSCANTPNCGSGYSFNLQTCRCQENSERAGQGEISGISSPEVINEQPLAERCSHVNCPRRYKISTATGTCKCKFDPTIRG